MRRLLPKPIGCSMNGGNRKTALPAVKTNGFKESDFVRNEPGRKKLEFVRKIVKARDAPGGSIQLTLSDNPNNGKIIEPVDLTEEDPLAVIENVEVNVSPLDVSLIEFDEIDPRELSIKTLEGIVHNDPLELNDGSPSKRDSSGQRICDICGEFFPSADLFHCDPENDYDPDCPPGSRTCAFCGEFYPSSELRHGCPESIAAKTPKKLVCSYCDQVYDSAELLDEHMYIHSSLPFICDRCGRFFDTKEDLSKHESMHGDTIRCEICNKMCDDNIELMVHTNEKLIPIECDNCGSLFSSLCKLSLHQVDCTPKVVIKEKFPCEECGQIFSMKPRLEAHYRQHTGERPFPCRYCQMTFSRKDTLSRHYRKNKLMRSQYGEHFKCNWCNKTFEVRCTLDAHIQEEHKDKVEEHDEDAEVSDHGESTDKESPTQTNDQHTPLRTTPNGRLLRARLQNSDQKVQNGDQKDQGSDQKNDNVMGSALKSVGIDKCEICEEVFFTRRALRQHQQCVHFGAKNYKCELCSKTFLHQPSLSKHMRRDHEQSGGMQCHICSRFFQASRHLRRHIAWHKAASFKCVSCGKVYTCEKNLIRHQKKEQHFSSACPDGVDGNLKSPENVNKAECSEASSLKSASQATGTARNEGKIGMTYAQLVVYMDKNEKPYKCDICDRVLRSRVHFIEHYVGHTKERPFKCDLCDQGFVRESKLAIHLASHELDHSQSQNTLTDDSPLLSQYEHLGVKTPTIRVNRFDLCPSTDGALKTSSSENVYKCSCGRFFGRKASLASHQRVCQSGGAKKSTAATTDSEPTAAAANSDVRAAEVSEIIFSGDTETFIASGIEHRTFMLNGRREFLCGRCGKIFHSYELLLKHNLVHTGEKPFKCTICPDREFMLRSSLRKHYRKWHVNSFVVGSTVAKKWPNLKAMTSLEGKRRLLRQQEPEVETVVIDEDDTDWSAMCQTELMEDEGEPTALPLESGVIEPSCQQNGYSESPVDTPMEYDMDAIDIFEPQVILEKEEKSDGELNDFGQPPQTVDGVALDQFLIKGEPNVPLTYNYNLFDHQFDDLSMNHFLEPLPSADDGADSLDSGTAAPTSDFFKDAIACIQCNAVFSEREDLVEHYASHDAAGDALKCGICKREFTKRLYLTQHAAIHTRAKIFRCSYCPKTFRTNRDIVQHERVHTGEKPFPCPVCGRHFRIKKSLRLHLRTHTGEKPHVCTRCSTPFAAYRTYKRHLVKCLERGTDTMDVPSNDPIAVEQLTVELEEPVN